MNGVYKLLQSGFIGPDTSDLIQIPQEERSVMQAVISQSLFRVDTSNYYDKGVQQLYSQMAADPAVFSDFQFREVILKKAFSLFDEAGFIDLINAQEQSPCYSYLHERYLKETLLYVYHGTPRAMSHSSYFRLLHVGANNSIFSAQQRESEEDSLKHVIRTVPNRLTVELLKRWTEDIEGMQDLLSTLNVIYGRRSIAAA